MTKSAFLLSAIKAVIQAEKIIMKYYSGNFEIQRKLDKTPVTIADTEAESIIINTLKQSFSNHAFLGEETGNNNINSKYQWIIDPIDGTKNFIRNIPLFATQLALLENNNSILGVSNAPALHEMIYAEKNKGTFLNNKQIHTSNVTKLSDSYCCFGGLKYFKKNNYIDPLFKLAENTRAARGIGDFWSYHLLSQGKIDIIVEAETKIWDIAALKIIIEEAGGTVTDLQGRNITKNPTSIIATNTYLHNEVVQLFSH